VSSLSLFLWFLWFCSFTALIVVILAEAVAKRADALAELPGNLSDPAGAEQEDYDHKDNQQFGYTKIAE
jgi:hypothetical protein